MRATDYIREKRRRPDTNAICDHLKKIETSNIDKETIGNIIPELINQKISKNKKSVYEDSFRLMTGFIVLSKTAKQSSRIVNKAIK